MGIDPSGVELYEYDGRDRLVWTSQAGEEVSYSYRADGLRNSKSSAGGTVTHLWDGANIAADMDGSAVIARYLRGVGLILADCGSGQKFYLYNGHGDVVQLANSSGVVVKDYDYSSFGVERDPDPVDANPFRYCGEYFDKETGTVYLRARYYQPLSGRFLTEDPIRSGENWYTYCINNPIRYIDPSGLAIVPIRVYLNQIYGIDNKYIVWDPITRGVSVTYNNETSTFYGYIPTDGPFKGIMLIDDSDIFKVFGSPNASIPAPSAPASIVAAENLPREGSPNSTGKLYNPDGSIKQERVYGPNGEPLRDIDYGHTHHHPDIDGPHVHDWLNGKRSNDPYPLHPPSHNPISTPINAPAWYTPIIDLLEGAFSNNTCPGIGGGPFNVPPTCFTGDTLIKTNKGFISIIDINVNDMVYSCDIKSGKMGYKRVTELFLNSSKQMVKITIGNEIIKTTSEHPFYVVDVGWVRAEDLVIGDEVKQLLHAQHVFVKNIEKIILEIPIPVFNFTVEDYHTYFVSKSEILVHNTCRQ